MNDKIKVIIFDVDGTIVKPWSAELLHGRKQKLEQLQAEGKRLFLASNQGGPAYHAWYALKNSGREREYPSLIKTAMRMESIRSQISAERCYIALHPGVDDIAEDLFERMQTDRTQQLSFMENRVVASYLLRWRKPRGEMLRQVLEDIEVKQKNAIYIGDKEIDMSAAQDAGIQYMDTDEFFFGR